MLGHSKLWLLGCMATMLAVPLAPANAQYNYDRDGDRGPPRFETVAELPYDRMAERVVFRLPAAVGRLAKIKIKSIDGPVLIERVLIRYSKGQPQDFQIFDRLGPGDESAAIDIVAGFGAITDIIVVKRPSFRPGRGQLAIIGQPLLQRPSPDEPRSAGGPGRWEPVQVQAYDRRDDSIVFRPDPRAGRTGQIRFRAVDEPLIMQGLVVKFANGGTQRIEIFDRLGPGEDTPPIDVDGERRAIAEIVVYKRPSWRPGRSQLELQYKGRPRPPHGAERGTAPPGWVLFGAQSVGFGLDRDVIEVGLDVGQFERIALAVRENDVYLREITVVYGNGERETRHIETLIPAESRTRPLDLKGDRFIRHIELVYQSRPDRHGQRAVVELYGDYAQGWLGERGAWRNHNQGWVMLGAQRAALFSNDKDSFPVGSRAGPIGRLKIACRRHAVRITGMTVTYGSGRTERVPILADLRDGSSTQVIPLARGERFVKSVQLRYRTKLNFAGEGIVQLWGAP